MRTFAVDVDSVLLDITGPMVRHFQSRYPEHEVYREMVQHWSIETSYGVSKEEVDEMWGHIFAEPSPSEEGAEEFIHRLKGDGWRVVAVTARIPKFQPALIRDVKRFALDDLIFTHDKETELRKLAPEGFIDDKIQHCHEAARAGVPRVFLLDQPWNYSMDLHVPYERVLSHYEVRLG
jgi:5'' nucleotidase, deoxy (Pyrimidine), cytosolic type C protein (NT5C).